VSNVIKTGDYFSRRACAEHQGDSLRGRQEITFPIRLGLFASGSVARSSRIHADMLLAGVLPDAKIPASYL